MERVLRQLEAIGKNKVEQPTIETIIKSKLSNWILNQVYQQKEDDQKRDLVFSATKITGIASVTYILQWSNELIDSRKSMFALIALRLDIANSTAEKEHVVFIVRNLITALFVPLRLISPNSLKILELTKERL
uniref:Uncharacterized protein n=1 Tax=Wuchereria bancrofti TaxID=6293 RepID=A0AAF5Q6D3_WUCBA